MSKHVLNINYTTYNYTTMLCNFTPFQYILPFIIFIDLLYCKMLNIL